MIQMTKHGNGYEVVIGSLTFSLPCGPEIQARAIEICADFDGPDSEPVRILRNCRVELELVNEDGVFENQIGVVVFVHETDARILKDDWECYSSVMSALGEACPSIERDRVCVCNSH